MPDDQSSHLLSKQGVFIPLPFTHSAIASSSGLQHSVRLIKMGTRGSRGRDAVGSCSDGTPSQAYPIATVLISINTNEGD
jgi:hypothetical protein